MSQSLADANMARKALRAHGWSVRGTVIAIEHRIDRATTDAARYRLMAVRDAVWAFHRGGWITPSW